MSISIYNDAELSIPGKVDVSDQVKEDLQALDLDQVYNALLQVPASVNEVIIDMCQLQADIQRDQMYLTGQDLIDFNNILQPVLDGPLAFQVPGYPKFVDACNEAGQGNESDLDFYLDYFSSHMGDFVTEVLNPIDDVYNNLPH